LANNFSLGGKHLHVEWESYVSLEKEERATRGGKSLKSHPAVFLVGGKTLEVQEQEVELDGVHKVTGLVSMQETLVLRARVFAMLELVPFNLMVKLNDRYTGLTSSQAHSALASHHKFAEPTPKKIKAELSTFMLPEVTDTYSSSFSPICMQG